MTEQEIKILYVVIDGNKIAFLSSAELGEYLENYLGIGDEEKVVVGAAAMSEKEFSKLKDIDE